MEWINLFGLIFLIVLLIPNIIYAFKQKVRIRHRWQNKPVLILEQIGRIGCMVFMCVILPGTTFGFSSGEALAVYLMGNEALILCYLVAWIFLGRRFNLSRALALSILPSVVFLFSGLLSHYIPLIVSALVFGPCHILISCQDVLHKPSSEETEGV